MAEKPSLKSLFQKWRANPLPAPDLDSSPVQEKVWSSSPQAPEAPEPEEALPEQPETIREALQSIEDFTVALAENATLRGRAHPKGTGLLTAEERERLLAPFRDQLLSDRQQLREALRQAFIRGVERVHRELHGAPGMDNEMLDQAIEFWSQPREDGPEVKV